MKVLELKGKCAERGITKKELAKKCGMSIQTFIRKERGNSFDIDNLKIIKSVLAMSDEEFLYVFFT